MEIVVDAYDAVERAMGWHCYLEDKLGFPFNASCSAPRPISPLRMGDEVKVIGMTSSDECMREMFVDIEWSDRTLGVPLGQLKLVVGARPSESERQTIEAVGDWHYWVARGYELG
ncbi:MAG: calcium-binding protein [Deltaproteobacteria bacterium]|nr:calcium-binding protein [Deltaproteobacteria bacterium]